MNPTIAKLMFLGLLSVVTIASASPARVASCVNHVIITFDAPTKIAAKLCQEFKSPSLYACYRQALDLGLTPDQGVELCRKADSLTPINCFHLVRTQTRLSAAESATACHGDKP